FPMGRLSRWWWRLPGLLAVTALLALPLAWWLARHPVPRTTTFIGTGGGVFGDDNGTGIVAVYNHDSFRTAYWELASGKKLIELDDEEMAHGAVRVSVESVRTADAKPDGVLVQERALDGALAQRGWRKLALLPVKHSGPPLLTFSPDGESLLVSDPESTMQLWNLGSHTVPLEFHYDQRGYKSLMGGRGRRHPSRSCFSADGRFFLTWEKALVVRDSTTGQVMGQVPANPWGECLSSQDRRFLVSQDSSSPSAWIWEIAAGSRIGRYQGWPLAISPGGDLLAVLQTGSGSARPLWPWAPRIIDALINCDHYREQFFGKIQIVDVATGKCLATFP